MLTRQQINENTRLVKLFNCRVKLEKVYQKKKKEFKRITQEFKDLYQKRDDIRSITLVYNGIAIIEERPLCYRPAADLIKRKARAVAHPNEKNKYILYTYNGDGTEKWWGDKWSKKLAVRAALDYVASGALPDMRA